MKIFKRHYSFKDILKYVQNDSRLEILNPPQADIKSILKPSHRKRDKDFIENHYNSIVEQLNGFVFNKTVEEKYNTLTKNQISYVINHTKSQPELFQLFEWLHNTKKLTRAELINILLNKSLVDSRIINEILYRGMVGGKQLSSEPKEWSESDFVCFQVALTQKFFSLHQLEHLKKLIDTNYQAWVDHIVNNELLPDHIERSIWRIHFIFVKNNHQLLELITSDQLTERNLFLMLESIPKSLLDSGLDEKLFNTIYSKLLATQLTFEQRQYLRLMGILRHHSELANRLKIISIKTKLHSHYLLQKTSEKPTIFNLSNPLSQALFSSLKMTSELIPKDDTQTTELKLKISQFKHELSNLGMAAANVDLDNSTRADVDNIIQGTV